MRLSLIYTLLLSGVSFSSIAQVGINANGTPPHSSAMLDISSNNRGLLIPRMTEAERDAIVDPAVGLQIYNSDTDCLNMWNGSRWKYSCFDCFEAPVAGSNSPVCEGGTLNLSATHVEGATYSWTGPNGFSSSEEFPSLTGISTSDAGVYSVSISLSGCNTEIASVSVSVSNAPSSPTASDDGPKCDGSTIQLSASTISNATYTWTGPGGFSSTQQNPSVPAAEGGAYSVTATVNGCSSAADVTNVTIYSLPDASFSYTPNNPQVAESVTFNPTQNGASSYAWTFSSGSPSSSSSSNPSVSWAADGTYSVGLTITDGNGCTNSSLTDVEIDPVPPKRVFATSTRFNGNFGGLTQGDGICQARANAASLGGTWKAWLSSTTESASSRLAHHAGPIQLVTGTQIADNWTDLTDGTLDNPINRDEFGNSASNLAWTNTNPNGSIRSTSPNMNCNNWTTAVSSTGTWEGGIGSPGDADGSWTQAGTWWCQTDVSSQFRLYCFEQ